MTPIVDYQLALKLTQDNLVKVAQGYLAPEAPADFVEEWTNHFVSEVESAWAEGLDVCATEDGLVVCKPDWLEQHKVASA